jgi:hypothetical protein
MLNARSRLATCWLITNHAWHLESGPWRAAMADRFRESGDRFHDVRARLEVERLAAMHDAGLTDDEVTPPSGARRLRYDNPAVDDDVPPGAVLRPLRRRETPVGPHLSNRRVSTRESRRPG